MALFQLLYMSSLAARDGASLPAILDVSVRNNKARNITGMLLFADGGILQVLEGERSSVMEVFRTVQADTRHTGILVLLDEEIPHRNFAGWSMGFQQLSPADLEKFPAAAAVFEAHRDEIAARVRPGDALRVMLTFAQSQQIS